MQEMLLRSESEMSKVFVCLAFIKQHHMPSVVASCKFHAIGSMAVLHVCVAVGKVLQLSNHVSSA